MADDPGLDFDGVPVIPFPDLRDDDEVVIAVGDGAKRRALATRCRRFATLFAPTSVIGRGVNIGEGSIFCDYAIVTACAKIGRHFHCNVGSAVAHDCVIGDFVTFAGGVSCNGNVQIGDGAYIGAEAVLMNGRPGKPLVIGEGAVVGIGAVVVRSVPAYATVFGNPARIISRRPPADAAAADSISG